MKTSTLVILSYFLLLLEVNAQGTWITLGSTATTCYAQSNADAVIGSKVFVGMGTDFCHDWKMYDPVNDAWSSKATLADTASVIVLYLL